LDGPITNVISVPRILIEVLLHAHAEGRKGLVNFRFATFTGNFLSDGAVSVAVKLKGLAKITTVLFF